MKGGKWIFFTCLFVCLFVFNALGVLNVHYINCAQLLGSV